ncbi:MAG: UDP-3-O-(3-hydroxymyristoyl)glucosamine N-acyltransferase [Nitrospirae bacterium]|nr:UDP-3-O-(3-hydroxymyristoyl)glucosamine N-acyltransferase [Candidatus Troglogloeales bacterium]MBI3598629.1 UDP-3-O-(3-hydroxymyristoyl)glucosamine N-acyltransferase [Candidatus Troglogloeales bacterium]
MQILLSDIARLIDGKIIGDPSILIHGINSIECAKAGDITFVSSPSYHKKAGTSHASAILSEREIKGLRKTFLLVANPYYAFARLLSYFHPPRQPIAGVDPRAVIGQYVLLGKEISIGPYVVVEDQVQIGNRVSLAPGVFVGRGSTVGDDTQIYPNVSIYAGVQIGKRVIIHSGSVVGSDGFGFTPYQSKHFKIPQVGGVIIEDDVELGANVTVDRAVLGNTIIGEGTKVDNQVQIGHNVTIGPHTLLVAQVGISGSVAIGHHVTLAGQVGISDHVQIGNNVVVGARSVVTKQIKDNEKVIGFPTLPYQKGLAVLSSLEHLPEIRKEIKKLKREVKKIK